MKTEFTAKVKVVPATGRNKGREYKRLILEIELPEEYKNWQIVPAYLYGAEVSLYQGVLYVRLRQQKDIRNVRR